MAWQRELRWWRRVVHAGDHEMRLDRWLRLQFPSAPQSLLQSQLRKRKIRLQPPPTAVESSLQSAKANSILLEGSVVAIDAHLFSSKLQNSGDGVANRPQSPRRRSAVDVPTRVPPVREKAVQDLLERVLHRDAHYIILNKPHGLAVQDGSALRDSLPRYFPALGALLANDDAPVSATVDDGSDPEMLKLVHRLDKETSGVLVLARSRLAAAKFSALLQRGAVSKTYEALVQFRSAEDEAAALTSLPTQITLPIEGKPACTVVERVVRTSATPRGVWLQLRPVTGRKHQLRIHCASGLNAPIVGDVKYGASPSVRLFLHATRIRFSDPFDDQGRSIDVVCNVDQNPPFLYK